LSVRVRDLVVSYKKKRVSGNTNLAAARVMQIERLKLEHKLSKGGWYGLLKTHWTREETDWSMLEMKKKI